MASPLSITTKPIKWVAYFFALFIVPAHICQKGRRRYLRKWQVPAYFLSLKMQKHRNTRQGGKCVLFFQKKWGHDTIKDIDTFHQLHLRRIFAKMDPFSPLLAQFCSTFFKKDIASSLPNFSEIWQCTSNDYFSLTLR